MGARRKYEIGYWVEEKDEIIGFNLDRDKVVGEFLNTLIEEAVKEWENQNNYNPLLHSNLLKKEIDGKKPNFFQSIHKLYSFTYYAVIYLLLNKKRINSLFKKDYETIEWLKAHLIDWVVEKDENGEIKDISINTSIVRPPSIYNSCTSTPEQDLHDNDFYEKIMKLLVKVEASGKKHTSIYCKILKIELFDQTHVTSEHGPILGVPKSEVASRRFEAFKVAKKIVIKEFPELKYIIDNLSKGTAHKAKKSTKKEREQNNQSDNEDDAKKHGPIKIVTKDGSTTTISYEESLKLKKNMPRWRGGEKAFFNTEALRKMLLSWFG